MIARLQTACEKLLGTAPEAALAAITQPLTSNKRRLGPQAAQAAEEALEQIERLVGRPTSSAVLSRHGVLEETIQKQADPLVVEVGRHLAGLTLPLVEDPAYRLAGAEEAVRQLIDRMEQLLQHQEPLCQELTQKAIAGHERLQSLLPSLPEIIAGGRRTAAVLAEFLELLTLYPKWRYQSLVLRRVCLAYTSLRGFLSDQLREIGFCRVRLGELLQLLEMASADIELAPASPGSALYPPGCPDVNAAVERLVAGATPEDLADFDQQLQEMVQQQFHGLVHVCTTSANLLKSLQQAMLTEGQAFAGARLVGDDVVEMFLDRYPSEQEAADGLAAVLQAAEPKFAGLSASEETQFTILAAPVSPYRDRLLALAPQTANVLSPDDIVVYREETDVLLSDLDHLGPTGRKAYEQLSAADNFSPHARMDITEWQPVAQAR